MIVMKFGGASLQDAEAIERVIEIIRGRLERRPVVVVSAIGKTTQGLLDAAEGSAAQNSKSALRAVSALERRHQDEVAKLLKGSALAAVSKAINHNFRELEKLLEGLVILGTVPPRGLDRILSYGEILSSIIVSGAMVDRGLPASQIDARRFMITNDKFGAASPLFEDTKGLLSTRVRPLLDDGLLPVTQGFIGATRGGATTTLGFEGSDYSATIIGAALDAEDVEIWKNVSGLMTTDPAIFAGARTVPRCSYAEAAELTRLGAKVLHYKAIHPAAAANIPVHILNSRKPAEAGTAVGIKGAEAITPFKSITYIRPVTLLNIFFDDQAGTASLLEASKLRELTALLERREVSPLITIVSGMRALLAIEAKYLEAAGTALMEELARIGRIGTERRRAIVTLVGEGSNGRIDIAARAFTAIKEIEVGLILRESSSTATSIVIDQADVERAIALLHVEFFDRAES